VAPRVDERAPRGSGVAAAAREIATRKARAVAARVRGPAVVLAADTLVAVGRARLGKARDARHARAILRKLSGTTHAVATGVCAIVVPEGRERRFAVTTRVTMRRWSEEELDAYVRSGEWKGKAGAYAIQESADRFVIRVRGSWTNVVGLPMERVVACLAALGVCALGRACPSARRRLRSSPRKHQRP